MTRPVVVWILTGLAAAIVLLGLAATALLLYSERFTSSVFCTDPEDFACSGHYVHGVPNEVWTVGATLIGVALLLLRIALRRRAASAATPPT